MLARGPAGTSPRFSIVIPAYSEEFYLGDCLESLQHQDFHGSVEVIVVDNDSSDATADVARAAGATVVCQCDRGGGQARQRGTEAASGTIIVSAEPTPSIGPAGCRRSTTGSPATGTPSLSAVPAFSTGRGGDLFCSSCPSVLWRWCSGSVAGAVHHRHELCIPSQPLSRL